MKPKDFFLFLSFISIVAWTAVSSCGPPKPSNLLPLPRDLGSPRNYQISRVITHFHSSYSYDACDKKGIVNGVVNGACINDLRKALCLGRVDFLFLTDHPSNMVNYEMQDLLLYQQGDQLLFKEGLPYANQMGTCNTQIKPTILVGFESQLLALGMSKHIESTPQDRGTTYQQDTLELRNRLAQEANALVVIPHTESKSIQWIEQIKPDGIEIYNFHANLDPKIRKTDLGLPPFENIPSLLPFLIDPYKQTVPDYSFLNFIEVSPIYFKKWNTLIHAGYQVTGLGGTDSHQNIFPQIVSDGERFDSHSRIARMMSNHCLVKNKSPDEVKNAIKNGQCWLVFEGFGTPISFDFYATTGNTVVGVGETHTLINSTATLTVKSPQLHPLSPQIDNKPIIRIDLKKVLPDGQDQTIATSQGSDLETVVSQPGAYRAEVTITPKHLKAFLGDFASQADASFLWIVTNHIFLE